jgi:hypothetical protein
MATWVFVSLHDYDQRQAAVIARYDLARRECVASGTESQTCTEQIYTACTEDPFWRSLAPFDWLIFSDPDSTASELCQPPGVR